MIQFAKRRHVIQFAPRFLIKATLLILSHSQSPYTLLDDNDN